MTINEYNEWISTLEVNSEVCISNIWDLTSNQISDFWISYDEKHICIITKIRGILEDGSIVVGGDIFNSNGVLENYNPTQEHIPVLCPINDDLLKLAWRHRFYDQMNEIDWRKVDDDTVINIIEAINEDIRKKELRMQQDMENMRIKEESKINNESNKKEKRKGFFKPIIRR